MRLMLAGAMVVLAACASQEMTKVTTAIDREKHLYLEEVEGVEALAWVRSQNDRTLAILENDARFKGYYEAALGIATSKERIPYGSIRQGHVYNFWQDEAHERGLWRRTTPASYASAAPEWETLLDLDALAKAEGANWVYKGVSCLKPEQTRCLLSLSDGGKDAVRVREYSIAEGGAKAGFVAGGFDIPEAKSSIAWQDKDTLLIATDWGNENKDLTGDKATLTESGYPFVIKRLKRGQALRDAVEVFRGERTDVATSPVSLEDGAGNQWFGAVRAETFYTSSWFIFSRAGEGRTLKLPIPAKSSPQGIFADTLLLTLEEDWTPEGQGEFKAGDLVGFNWSGFVADGNLPKVDLVFRPTPKQALQGVGITKNNVLVNISDNVVVKVMAYRKDGANWISSEVKLPPNGSAGVIFSDSEESTAFLGYEGYLSPDTLYTYDSTSGAVAAIKQLPAWFDAGPYKVDQYEATSKDGTKVPYFVVHKADMPLDGSNPTLLSGYGGFESSLLPGYSATVGKLWLERGGVYVIANTRGGGEFGPRWHEAALQQNRQRAHEDFQAVALDLIARDITSQPKLGIMGGSQGGLFMGAMLTQRPDLINAAVIQVPLFDMLRFNKLLAGASWQGEYGNPDVPEERAWIQAYSPYQNLRAGMPYPEVFIHTSTKDDRVHPGHARKAAARLEELGYPVLFYENTDGGHAAGANLLETARRIALEYTYLTRRLMDQPAQQ